MSPDIQFGELEQTKPQRGLRPDQDGHYVVTKIGKIADGELAIYVDLDVLRDMEAHARSNTRVELGGVMLGQQQIDDSGRPFVLIDDCLRARHYEATKGSFKFTHDTWSQITRERKQFRPDLEMVGWYHTHPGWSVFLSGMDLFICNNFFNRPLDVALVIDPCADDRGWFQWTTGDRQETRRTSGFYLTTGRYRQQELNHFARMYNKEPTMMPDPRYSNDFFGAGAQPVVNLMDNRRPIFEVAIVAMLMTQFLLFAAITWKVLSPASGYAIDDLDKQQVALLQQKITDMESTRIQQTRDQAYQEVLQSIVGAQTGDHKLVENFADLKSSNQQLQSNIEAQMALTEKLNRERESALRDADAKTAKVDSLSLQLVATREKLADADTRLATLSASLNGANSGEQITAPGVFNIAWWWLTLGGTGLTAVGGAIGFWLARHQAGFDEYENEIETVESRVKSAEIRPRDRGDHASDKTVKIVDGEFEDQNKGFSPPKTTTK